MLLSVPREIPSRDDDLTDKPDPWKCSYCAVHFPVPMLARACEDGHAAYREDDTNQKGEGDE